MMSLPYEPALVAALGDARGAAAPAARDGGRRPDPAGTTMVAVEATGSASTLGAPGGGPGASDALGGDGGTFAASSVTDLAAPGSCDRLAVPRQPIPTATAAMSAPPTR